MDVQLKLFVLPTPFFGNLVAGGELLVKLLQEDQKENNEACTSFCFKFENPIFSLLKYWTKGCGVHKEEEEEEEKPEPKMIIMHKRSSNHC